MTAKVIPLVDQRAASRVPVIPVPRARPRRHTGGHARPALARPAYFGNRPLQLPLHLLHAQGSIRQGLPIFAEIRTVEL